MRLAVVASHPIQYYAPLFREFAKQVDLQVFFAHRATPVDQARAGFGVEFDWDVDLLQGYRHTFLVNVARRPGVAAFAGCNTPEIGSLLAQGRFDAVLLMGWNLKSFIQALVAAKRFGIPALVRGDSNLLGPVTLLKKFAKTCAYPTFLRSFDAALYVGKRSRDYWINYNYPPERLFFSPHCVDAQWFANRATTDARATLRARLGIAPETKVALFAGKLVPFKRPHDFISAAARLKAIGRQIDLLVAGSGPLEPELTLAAKEVGLRCHFLGFCNQTAMPSAYAAADVLVLPSDGRETWGMVANEALACGKPIVVSDAVGCAPDLAVDGTAGRVSALANIDSLSSAIADIIDHPPQPAAIEAKSALFSVSAAAEGLRRAAAFTIDTRGR